MRSLFEESVAAVPPNPPFNLDAPSGARVKGTLGLMKRILLACVLFSTAALADNFADRVAEARKASSTPEGKKYDQLLVPAIGAAMRACVPPGSTSPANLGKFTLIGYVASSGAVSLIEVQPKTEVSVCFAAQFEQARFASPPKSGQSKVGFPIAVEMSLVP